MNAFDNEGRLTVWKEAEGQHGKYRRVTFQLNGVEYICFAGVVESTNPKAPDYGGKLKISANQPQGVPAPQTTTQPAPTQAPQTQGGDLPWDK